MHIIDTKAKLLELAAILDKLFALPAKGEHQPTHTTAKRLQRDAAIFGLSTDESPFVEVHVPMTDVPGSPGWTMKHGELRQHPSDGRWAYPWHGPIAAMRSDPEVRKRCTGRELGQLTAAAAKAKHLDPDWEPEHD